MNKDEILKVFKELNNNFGPEDEILSIDVNGVKYNLSIEKLKSYYPKLSIEQIRKIFEKNDLELPEVKPSLKSNQGVKKSNTSMLIDLINLAHNKPISTNHPSSTEIEKERSNRTKLKIAGGILVASVMLFFVMFFIEKNSEKNFKFTENRKQSKGNKAAERGFKRKKLQKPQIETLLPLLQRASYKKEK